MAAKKGLTLSSSSTCLSFLVTLISIQLLISSTAAQEDQKPLYHFCLNDQGNFTDGSAYASNLNRLLSSVGTLQSNDYGFYNFSRRENGTEADRCNAIALCRGDVKPDACVRCVRTASEEIRDRCPNQKEAVIWYDDCMFRYSNMSLLGVMELTPKFYMWNRFNLTDKAGFERTLRELLERLKTQAAAGGGRRKYAAGEANSTAFVTAYALVQCTPDLSREECDHCLTENIAEIPRCCDGKRGGRVISPSCNFRFEIFPFFDPAADPRPPPPAPSPAFTPPPPLNETAAGEGKGNGTPITTIIAIVIPIVAIFIIIGLIFAFKKLKKQPKKKPEGVETFDDEIISVESLQLDFETIREATDNFSSNNKLGEGGFGSVYKGRLYNGQNIAVKRLSRNSGQGDAEFKNEVMLVAKLQHRNLVRLLGFCLEGTERLLIYEFVENASLDKFIFDPIKPGSLDWEKRYKIIGGVARGLLYLHEDSRVRIIHRDLKASNILLDEQMNPKIADFGMARLFDMTQTMGATSRIVGTYGYMAPEYAMHGWISFKIDVFSFGVLVLEIVSGQKNNNFRSGESAEDLLSAAWRNWREGTTLNLVDPSLTYSSSNEIIRCIHIGLLCVQENIANRPTMASVVLMLNSFSTTLPMPSTPAFVMNQSNMGQPLSNSRDYNSRGTETSNSREENLPLSMNEASITELYPR